MPWEISSRPWESSTSLLRRRSSSAVLKSQWDPRRRGLPMARNNACSRLCIAWRAPYRTGMTITNNTSNDKTGFPGQISSACQLSIAPPCVHYENDHLRADPVIMRSNQRQPRWASRRSDQRRQRRGLLVAKFTLSKQEFLARWLGSNATPHAHPLHPRQPQVQLQACEDKASCGCSFPYFKERVY